MAGSTAPKEAYLHGEKLPALCHAWHAASSVSGTNPIDAHDAELVICCVHTTGGGDGGDGGAAGGGGGGDGISSVPAAKSWALHAAAASAYVVYS